MTTTWLTINNVMTFTSHLQLSDYMSHRWPRLFQALTTLSQQTANTASLYNSNCRWVREWSSAPAIL